MATAGELHPTEGIRMLLVREAVEDHGRRARYQAALYTPDRSYEYRAELCDDGEAELTSTGDEAPPPQRKKLENLLRSLARAAGRKAADGLEPWPPRVLRWRAD
jgi:hypothetical protein